MPLPKFDRIKKDQSLTPLEMQSQSVAVAAIMDKLEATTSVEDKIVNIKIIPRSKIVFNKENDYSQENIEKLASSILQFKLQNIPSGHYDEEQDIYVLENGERRTRALDMLVERYSDPGVDKESREYQLYVANVKRFEKGYPFHLLERLGVEQPISRLDEVVSQLRLEDANLEARFDSEERALHIQKRIDLLKEYNALVGEESQINIPETIANNFEMTKRQAFKYTTVATNLIPELQSEFQKKNINLDSASSMAALPEEMQFMILEMLQAGEKVDLAATKKLQEEMERLREESEQALKEKENRILALTEEKERVEASVDTIVKSVEEVAEKERAQLRVKLEEELRKEIPNPDKVNALENQLKDTTEKHKTAIKQLEKSKRSSEEKDVQITMLKEEMQQLRQGLSNDDATKRAKAELGYQSALKVLKTAIDDYHLFIVENRDVLEGADPTRIEEDMEALTIKIKTTK